MRQPKWQVWQGRNGWQVRRIPERSGWYLVRKLGRGSIELTETETGRLLDVKFQGDAE